MLIVRSVKDIAQIRAGNRLVKAITDSVEEFLYELAGINYPGQDISRLHLPPEEAVYILEEKDNCRELVLLGEPVDLVRENPVDAVRERREGITFYRIVLTRPKPRRIHLFVPEGLCGPEVDHWLAEHHRWYRLF